MGKSRSAIAAKLATQPEVSINITENKVTVPLNEVRLDRHQPGRIDLRQKLPGLVADEQRL